MAFSRDRRPQVAGRAVPQGPAALLPRPNSSSMTSENFSSDSAPVKKRPLMKNAGPPGRSEWGSAAPRSRCDAFHTKSRQDFGAEFRLSSS